MPQKGYEIDQIAATDRCKTGTEVFGVHVRRIGNKEVVHAASHECCGGSVVEGKKNS